MSVDVLILLEKAFKPWLCSTANIWLTHPTLFPSRRVVLLSTTRRIAQFLVKASDTELMRILSNWLTPYAWSVVGQWPMALGERAHISLVNNTTSGRRVPKAMSIHSYRRSQYMKLLSATDAWTIHFTCQDDFAPVEPSPDLLSKGINILHFVHDLAWTKVVLHGYRKDLTGCTQSIAGKIIVDNAMNATR